MAKISPARKLRKMIKDWTPLVSFRRKPSGGLDKALLAIPSAIGLTQDELQEIADVCITAIGKANKR